MATLPDDDKPTVPPLGKVVAQAMPDGRDYYAHQTVEGHDLSIERRIVHVPAIGDKKAELLETATITLQDGNKISVSYNAFAEDGHLDYAVKSFLGDESNTIDISHELATNIDNAVKRVMKDGTLTPAEAKQLTILLNGVARPIQDEIEKTANDKLPSGRYIPDDLQKHDVNLAKAIAPEAAHQGDKLELNPMDTSHGDDVVKVFSEDFHTKKGNEKLAVSQSVDFKMNGKDYHVSFDSAPLDPISHTFGPDTPDTFMSGTIETKARNAQGESETIRKVDGYYGTGNDRGSALTVTAPGVQSSRGDFNAKQERQVESAVTTAIQGIFLDGKVTRDEMKQIAALQELIGDTLRRDGEFTDAGLQTITRTAENIAEAAKKAMGKQQ